MKKYVSYVANLRKQLRSNKHEKYYLVECKECVKAGQEPMDLVIGRRESFKAHIKKGTNQSVAIDSVSTSASSGSTLIRMRSQRLTDWVDKGLSKKDVLLFEDSLMDFAAVMDYHFRL